MKFQLILPAKNNYKYLGLSANKTRHIWQDKAVSIVQVQSTIENPFNRQVSLFFALETGQTKESRRTGGNLRLKEHKLDFHYPLARSIALAIDRACKQIIRCQQ